MLGGGQHSRRISCAVGRQDLLNPVTKDFLHELGNSLEGLVGSDASSLGRLVWVTLSKSMLSTFIT